MKLISTQHASTSSPIPVPSSKCMAACHVIDVTLHMHADHEISCSLVAGTSIQTVAPKSSPYA